MPTETSPGTTGSPQPLSLSPPKISLPPVPGLEFFDLINGKPAHNYRYQGRWVRHSITKVVNTKTPEEMERIFAHRSDWEPRGNFVHNALHLYVTEGDHGDQGDYSEWITPLCKHWMWGSYEPIASELLMVDSRYDIAGACDLILQDVKTGELVMADLKTQSSQSSRPRDISPQLGGYINLFDLCYPEHAGKVTKGIAIWCKPGETTLTTYEGENCLMNYYALRNRYLEQLPENILATS